MLNTRVEQVRHRLDAHKRALAMMSYGGDSVRLCLIEIAKAQAELDRLENNNQDYLAFEDFDGRDSRLPEPVLTPSSSIGAG